MYWAVGIGRLLAWLDLRADIQQVLAFCVQSAKNQLIQKHTTLALAQHPNSVSRPHFVLSLNVPPITYHT